MNFLLKQNHRAFSRATLEPDVLPIGLGFTPQCKAGRGLTRLQLWLGGWVAKSYQFCPGVSIKEIFNEHNYNFEKHPESKKKVIRKKHFDIYSDVRNRVVTKAASLMVFKIFPIALAPMTGLVSFTVCD